MPNPLSPEEQAARDRFIAEHGRGEIPRGTYTADVYAGHRIVGKRVVSPGQAEAEAPVVPKRRLKAGRGRVPVEEAGSEVRRLKAEIARLQAEIAGGGEGRGGGGVPARPALPAPAGPDWKARAAAAEEKAAALKRALREEGDRTALAEQMLAEREARIGALEAALAGRDRLIAGLEDARDPVADNRQTEQAANPAFAGGKNGHDTRSPADPAPAGPEPERREPTRAELREMRGRRMGAAAMARKTGLTRPEIQALLFRWGI